MDKKSKVIVLRCDDYDEEKIYTLLKIGLDQLGGLESFINKERKNPSEAQSSEKSRSRKSGDYPSCSSGRFCPDPARRGI